MITTRKTLKYFIATSPGREYKSIELGNNYKADAIVFKTTNIYIWADGFVGCPAYQSGPGNIRRNTII